MSMVERLRRSASSVRFRQMIWMQSRYQGLQTILRALKLRGKAARCSELHRGFIACFFDSLLLQHRSLLVVLRCGDDEKEQAEMLKVDSEMQLAVCFLPSQTNWEDSYGNQEGK
jgi:hypothetical protein